MANGKVASLFDRACVILLYGIVALTPSISMKEFFGVDVPKLRNTSNSPAGEFHVAGYRGSGGDLTVKFRICIPAVAGIPVYFKSTQVP